MHIKDFRDLISEIEPKDCSDPMVPVAQSVHGTSKLLTFSARRARFDKIYQTLPFSLKRFNAPPTDLNGHLPPNEPMGSRAWKSPKNEIF